MVLLAYIFLLHWVGDFLFQSRWIAINKSSNVLALTFHVVAYATVLHLGLSFTNIDLESIIGFCMINFALHWLTDLGTSQVTKYFKQRDNDYGFFSTIGFDQLIHHVTLMTTYHYVIGLR